MLGCPIRISTDQRLFAPPRSFSQLITSFIAWESQGIHHVPFLIFFSLLSLIQIFQIIRACASTSSESLIFIFCAICQRSLFLWRITDSNRWPSACKADALASWANPPVVVPGRVELPTSTLSVWRSNQLSYRTVQPLSSQIKTFLLLYLKKQQHSKEKKEKTQPSINITTILP